MMSRSSSVQQQRGSGGAAAYRRAFCLWREVCLGSKKMKTHVELLTASLSGFARWVG